MSEIELPEPAGHVVNMGGEDGWGVSDHTSTYDLDSGCDVYTAEQVRAAILAERERCAKVAERTTEFKAYAHGNTIADEIAAVIRRG